jgi:HEAT repeat protein/SAM-dependent methyltransferase
VIDQRKLHRKAWSRFAQIRREAVNQLSSTFGDLPDKERAWADLIQLTGDKDRDVRCGAAKLLDMAFPHLPEDYRAQAWQDLLQFKDRYVRGIATVSLSTAFPHLPEDYRAQAWQDLIRLTGDEERPVRFGAAWALGAAFPHLPENYRAQAWADLHRLTGDVDIPVRDGAALALGTVFPHLPEDYRVQAWQDLHRLTGDEIMDLRWGVAASLGAAFTHLPEAHRVQAWQDLIRLTGDKYEHVRWGAAASLGAAFTHLPEAHRVQAWQDLIRLTGDEHAEVRLYANQALGKVSIVKATETDSEDDFRKELETALAFFDTASQELAVFNPALFCSLFYRSYYAITFQRSAENEVQRYLTEAKRAAKGSKSREELIEAIANLADALKEARDARASDLEARKRDLNAYRRYCDRAAALLDITEKEAPTATKVLRRGLLIIDQRIKEAFRGIKEESKKICESATAREAELGCKLTKHATDVIAADNPVEVLRNITYILNDFEDWSNSIADVNERKYVQGMILDARNADAPDAILLIRSLLARVLMFSKAEREEKTISQTDVILESEIRDIFKSVYQKERTEGMSEVNSKTLAFLKAKLHDLAAAGESFKWLDVGCGYGRALDVLDAANVPRDLFEYHGVDAEHRYLDEAEKQARKYRLLTWKIEKMNAAQMKFDSEYDLVSAVLLLHEVDPLCLPHVLRNLIRALTPEGTLVISDFQGPYEQEKGVVAWRFDDIKCILESICAEVKVSCEPIPADQFPKERGFYACYVKKSPLDDQKFEALMQDYHTFLERKKQESKTMRDELKQQLKDRVTGILKRSDIDTKNITDEEMERITRVIEPEYGLKAHSIRLFINQIEFLEDKIAEFKRGERCAGA